MKIQYIVAFIVLVIAAVALAIHLRSRRVSSGPVVHVENGFVFTVHAPYKNVAPLFGAHEERAWGGPDWNPHFLYPQPARDIAGEVFSVAHGHTRSTWVNTAFDLESGHVQYVYVVPDAQAVLIDIHLHEDSPSSTTAKVVYQRTALTAGFNSHVTELGEKDATSANEWQTAIESYLDAHSMM
jgi:hypothetical protein